MQWGRAVKLRPGTHESSRRSNMRQRSKFFFEKSVQLGGEPMSIQSVGPFGGYEYHICVGRHFLPIQSEVFPEPPLDPISSASSPNSPAGGYSQPCPAQQVIQHSDLKVGRSVTGALLHDLPEIGRQTNSVSPCQTKTTGLRPTGACVPLPFSA